MVKSGKILFYVILSGVTTGLGAFVGAIVGNISQKVIAVCLALAAGAMLYIVSGELTPEYNKLYSGKMSSIGNMIGFILGLLVMLLIACGMMLPSLANLPTEDGCDKKCDKCEKII